MIAPLPPAILSSNPQFAALHKTLTTKLLDRDASTKATNTSSQPVEEQVTKNITQAARRRILSQALRNLAFPDHDDDNTLTLPAELRELIYIVSTCLLTTPKLTPSQTGLLAVKIRQLKDQLPSITTALSHDLQAQQSHLYAIALTTTTGSPPGTLPRYSLHLHLASTLSHLSTLQTQISTIKLNTINALLKLLSLHAVQLTAHLTHLTRHTHGTLSRHVLARSTHQATIAQTLSCKLQLLSLEARRSTYSAPTQAALANYASHLDELILQLDSRTRTLEDELRLYAECDGREGQTMAELGRRYKDVVEEIEVVKGDVERLEGKRDGMGERGRNEKGRKVSRRDFEIP